MGLLKTLRPARQEASADTRIVVDLDRLAAEPIGFRFKGRVHTIKPITTERFLVAMNEWAELMALEKQTKLDQQKVIDRFVNIFAAVCDTITRQDVLDMTLAQRGALLQQVFEIITGKAFSEKKSPVTKEAAQTT